MLWPLISVVRRHFMHYGATTLGTGFTDEMLNSWKVRIVKTLLFFMPRANPDVEKLYPLVKEWALELSDEGWPKREVGLDAERKPLFRTPNNRNTGFWIDMSETQFKRSDLRERSEEHTSELQSREN